jgi:hypothetical protein
MYRDLLVNLEPVCTDRIWLSAREIDRRRSRPTL